MDFDFSKAVTSTKAAKPIAEDDFIGQDLEKALKQYLRGNFKSAMSSSVDAINALANREDLQGGAWL